jgi:hypothetical protein
MVRDELGRGDLTIGDGLNADGITPRQNLELLLDPSARPPPPVLQYALAPKWQRGGLDDPPAHQFYVLELDPSLLATLCSH